MLQERGSSNGAGRDKGRYARYIIREDSSGTVEGMINGKSKTPNRDVFRSISGITHAVYDGAISMGEYHERERQLIARSKTKLLKT